MNTMNDDMNLDVMNLRPEQYETLNGIFVRKSKPLDHAILSSINNTITSATVLTSTVLPSTKNALLLGISVGSNNMATLSVVASSSGTLFSITGEDGVQKTLTADSDIRPLAFIPAGETITLVAVTLNSQTSATLNSSAWFKLEPTVTIAETE